MKKLFLAAAIALMGIVTVNAQTSKGNWVVSGKTGLDFLSSNAKVKYDGKTMGEQKTSKFTLAGEAGYFVMDNLSVGLALGYDSTTQKIEGSDYTSSNTVVMPVATYYFSGEQVKPYVGAGVGLSSMKANDVSESGLAWGVKGGIVYLLNKTVGLDLGLSYAGSNYSLENDVKYNVGTFGVNAGISIFLGK